MSSRYNLAAGLAHSAITAPDAIALNVGGYELSYRDLAHQAARLARHLARGRKTRRVGILGTRSIEAYIGILGACWAGSAYVPLNLKWPAERLVTLLQQLQLDALVADEHGAALLTDEVLSVAPDWIIVPDKCELEPATPKQRIDQRGSIPQEALEETAPMADGDVGYIIFTSGTTGIPKGVMISAGSLAHYLEQSEPWTGYTPADRIGEACDITFDLSVHNLFLCLRAGASLHVMSQLDMLAPARFIRSHRLTAWMSVPTLIAMMRKTGALKPGIFPSLRLSIFCGEPLPVAAAQAWAEATPNGIVENIYGPTEATVICLRQRLTSPPVVTSGRDIVAIGRPYETMRVEIFDETQHPVPPGQAGEIALSGPQLGIGYFGQPELTAERFRIIRGQRWYLTGDLGRMDECGVFHHLGRVDNQVKLKGNRVELEEIDAHLRRAAGTELVATVAWPMSYGSADGLVGFVAGGDGETERIREAMTQGLPRYLVPGRIIRCATLPQNINGKIDRNALIRMLDRGEIATPLANVE